MWTDIFKFDPNYLENEEKYKSIKAEILGEDSDEESGSEETDDSDEDEEGTLVIPCAILAAFDYFWQWRKSKVSKTKPKQIWSTSAVSSTLPS